MGSVTWLCRGAVFCSFVFDKSGLAAYAAVVGVCLQLFAAIGDGTVVGLSWGKVHVYVLVHVNGAWSE